MYTFERCIVSGLRAGPDLFQFWPSEMIYWVTIKLNALKIRLLSNTNFIYFWDIHQNKLIPLDSMNLCEFYDMNFILMCCPKSEEIWVLKQSNFHNVQFSFSLSINVNGKVKTKVKGKGQHTWTENSIFLYLGLTMAVSTLTKNTNWI